MKGWRSRSIRSSGHDVVVVISHEVRRSLHLERILHNDRRRAITVTGRLIIQAATQQKLEPPRQTVTSSCTVATTRRSAPVTSDGQRNGGSHIDHIDGGTSGTMESAASYCVAAASISTVTGRWYEPPMVSLTTILAALDERQTASAVVVAKGLRNRLGLPRTKNTRSST